MVTKAQKAKPSAKTTKERPAARGSVEKGRAKTTKAAKQFAAEKKKVLLDYGNLYTDSMDEIARRQNVECSTMDSADAMSSGMLQYDLMLGGGVRPSLYTSAGEEQSAKTTNALTVLASAIKHKIPLIEWFDYEGCVTANTYIGYGKGKHAKLKDLFDLSDVSSWVPGTWPGQTRTDIDTVEPGHRHGGTGVRTGSLFYKGKKRTTKVTFNTGHHIIGHGHKMFVLRNGVVSVVRMEQLLVGEQVLVDKRFLPETKEIWVPVSGFGKVIKERYEVSNQGRVRSRDFISPREKFDPRSGSYSHIDMKVKGRILSPNAVADGHVWVALCDGKVQKKLLVHRIVARNFIGKLPFKNAKVLHWNDDPSDNRICNIRYGTEKENANDRKVRGRSTKGEAIHTAVLNPKLVSRIFEMRDSGIPGSAIARSLNVHNSTIYGVLSGKYWQHTHEETTELELTKELLNDFEISAVTSVELTNKLEHVFDVSLSGVGMDLMPHSIITNGVVTHNSTKNSRPYVLSIMRGAGIKVTTEQLFGKKDAEGKWIIRPIVRYHNETVLEKFFDYISEVLRKLPDKKLINKKWWLIFEDNKVNSAKYGEFADKTMPKKYGKGIWVEAPDGNMQGIVFVDSWAAMNPRGNDEEEGNKSLALQARAFAQNLPRVKGRLADKMVAVIGTNLLSDIPMAMYGPKQQEIGGKRLRGLSDVRNRNVSVSSNQPLWPKTFNKQFEEVEHSVEVEGGVDRYRYIKSKAIKNKLWTPNREGWFRVWIEDGKGDARGFDPFFDTMLYLRQTGQLIGKGRNPSKTGGGGLSLNLDGLGKTKAIKWLEYKQWILGSREDMIAVCKKAGIKPMSLRAFCFKQMANGVGEKLYVENSRSAVKDSEDE